MADELVLVEGYGSPRAGAYRHVPKGAGSKKFNGVEFVRTNRTRPNGMAIFAKADEFAQSIPDHLEHYIVVRVSEPLLKEGYGPTHAGRVRRAIHDVADEYGLCVSDVLIRGDRDTDNIGRSLSESRMRAEAILQDGFYPEWVKQSAERQNAVRRANLARRNPNWEEEREHRDRKNRARRAKAIVDNYIEDFGDDL